MANIKRGIEEAAVGAAMLVFAFLHRLQQPGELEQVWIRRLGGEVGGRRGRSDGRFSSPLLMFLLRAIKTPFN